MTTTAPIKNRTSQRSGAQRAHAGKAGTAVAAVAGLEFGWDVAGGIGDMKNSVRRPQAWQEKYQPHRFNPWGYAS
jgi:hypothetical protein